MTFRNPILGAGGSTLLRPAIQSPNYVPGVSGWAVFRNGDAEFNGGTFRGGTSVSGAALYYNGTPAAGNLILSIAATAGTDEFGNAYAAGMTLYSANGTINLDDTAATWNATPSGAGIQIIVGPGSVLEQFSPAVVSGVTWERGAVGASLASRLGTNTPEVFLISPANNAHPSDNASISLYGAPQTSNGDVLSEAIIQAARMWADVANGWITGAWSKLSETWTTPTYNANWSGTTTFGTIAGGLRALQYRTDAEDNLYLCGTFTAAAGAGNSVFNLPVGYRPTKNTPIPVAFISSGGTAGNAWMYVSTAGNLNINSQLGSATTTGTAYTINAKIPLGNLA